MKKITYVLIAILSGTILLSACGTVPQEEHTTTDAGTSVASQITTSEPMAQTVTTASTAEPVTQTAETVATTESISQATTTEPPAQITEATTEVTTVAATAAPVVPEPLPNDGQRDELFAKRIANPITYVRSVGGVRYTVTLDREEYYVGDDLNIHVVAENLGTEPILVIKQAYADLSELIRVSVCISGTPVAEIDMGYIKKESAIVERIDQWMPGETAEELGRQPLNAGLADGEMSLLVSVDGTHRVEIPLTVHKNVPRDCELYPYRENGDISAALYRRALVMNEEETIPVVIPKAWDRTQILPGAETQPLPESYGYEDNLFLEFDGAVVHLTRVQLIEMLKYQAPLKTSSRPALKYIYETMLVNVLSQAYPLKNLN